MHSTTSMLPGSCPSSLGVRNSALHAGHVPGSPCGSDAMETDETASACDSVRRRLWLHFPFSPRFCLAEERPGLLRRLAILGVDAAKKTPVVHEGAKESAKTLRRTGMMVISYQFTTCRITQGALQLLAASHDWSGLFFVRSSCLFCVVGRNSELDNTCSISSTCYIYNPYKTIRLPIVGSYHTSVGNDHWCSPLQLLSFTDLTCNTLRTSAIGTPTCAKRKGHQRQ